MEEINLLQNRLKDTTHTRQKQTLNTIRVLMAVLMILIAVTAAFFFLTRSTQKKSAIVIAENQAVQQKLTDKEKDLIEAKVFQAQLANLRILLKNHIYISPLFDELTASTYNKAQYLTIDVVESGKLHVEGMVGSYKDLGKLILGLSTSSKFKDVKLTSVMPGSDLVNGYKFSIDMAVSPEIFTKK